MPKNFSSPHDRRPSARHPQRMTQSQKDEARQSADTSRRPRYKVTEPAQLLEFLLQKIQGSATNAKNLLKHRCILVNGSEIVTQFDRALVPGDEITVLSPKDAQYGLFHPLLKILYEDDYILAVEKGSGLLSVDTTKAGGENAADILDHYVKKRDASKRIYVVHRLDRDTSGVMLFAKCREAQAKLVADWNDRVLERTYIAIAEGCPSPEQGTVDSYLYQDDHMVVHSTMAPEQGLRAITHYKVLQKNDAFSRVQCDLETGRTNQIRVHLQSLGHSLVGDEKYGSTTNPIGRLGLHALNIKFYHPISQKVMKFSVPEPSSFAELFDEAAAPEDP